MEQYFGAIKKPAGTLLGTPAAKKAAMENRECSQPSRNRFN
jgi:hypothetical protein